MDAILAFLPILIFAALCPLMMLLMMRGMHGGHGGHGSHDERSERAQSEGRDAAASDDTRLRQLESELDALRRRRAGSWRSRLDGEPGCSDENAEGAPILFPNKAQVRRRPHHRTGQERNDEPVSGIT